MLKIYLARHGQNLDNANGILNGHRDEPLTELGLNQAAEVAEKIKQNGLTFDVIFSSPLRRAFCTAEIIAEATSGPKPLVLPELIERDFGVMTGKEISQIEELCGPEIIKTNTVTYFLSPPDAETFPQLLARAKKVLARIQAEYTDGNVLLVTHGDFGKMIYASYYQLDWKEVLTGFHFGNSELLIISADSHASDTHVVTVAQHNA